jgi:hypothetical protein
MIRQELKPLGLRFGDLQDFLRNENYRGDLANPSD